MAEKFHFHFLSHFLSTEMDEQNLYRTGICQYFPILILVPSGLYSSHSFIHSMAFIHFSLDFILLNCFYDSWKLEYWDTWLERIMYHSVSDSNVLFIPQRAAHVKRWFLVKLCRHLVTIRKRNRCATKFLSKKIRCQTYACFGIQTAKHFIWDSWATPRK